MNYTTTIPVGKIDEDELLGFVERLQKITGQTLIVEKQYAICTNDTTISAMLDGLKEIAEDASRVSKVTVNVTKVKARSKLVKKAWKKNDEEPKPAPSRGPHVRSIQIDGTGEMISRFELDKRLTEKTIPVGTKLHSPKHGAMSVDLDPVDNATYVLVNEQGEQL